MRFAIALVILAMTLPAVEAANSPKGVCKDRCGNQYRFCLKNASTKQARKSCRTTRGHCKGQCSGK